MNKIKLEITDKLELVALVPSIVYGVYPDTTIEVKNWKDFKDYKLECVLKYNTDADPAIKFKDGKCIVKTSDLCRADNLTIMITSKNNSYSLDLNLNSISFNAKVFQKEETSSYLQLFHSMLDYIEELDARVQQLEIDNQKEII